MSAHMAGRHPVRSPIARWRGVFMALALALTVGSAGQPPPAQAAPAGATEIRYQVIATLAKSYGTICVGDKVPISVNVVRTSMDNNIQTDSLNISGIWVAGSVQDPGIGKLIIARKRTSFDYEQPGIAGFIFHADKPGKTTLTFKAEIHYYQSTILKWIYGPAEIVESNPVEVTVEDCKYNVTAISHWAQGGLKFVALIMETEMTTDAPGHYTGTATVDWFITNTPRPGCSPVMYYYTSQADLTGSMDADGQQLVVDLAYQVAELQTQTYDSNCDANSTLVNFYTPAPLTLSLPSYGGVSTQSQVAVNQDFPILNMTGSAKVRVVPVTSH
jgi:hypothetical protein